MQQKQFQEGYLYLHYKKKKISNNLTYSSSNYKRKANLEVDKFQET